MRLGRFEKWLLIHCYKKTVENDLPPEWKYPKDYPVGKTSEFHQGYLFKSEILLNYFPELKASGKFSWYRDVVEKFVTNADYKKALTLYRRTTNRLESKGFIKEYICDGGRYWTGIQLTEAGIEKAKKLTDDISLPGLA